MWNWTVNVAVAFWDWYWVVTIWSWNAFDDVYVYIRDWAKTLTLQDFYLFMASIALLSAWFILVSLFLWALEGWEVISLNWWRSFLNILKDQLYAFASLEYINRPLNGVMNVLAALSADRRFDTDNEGLVIMFIWFVYPVLWILSTTQALTNIFVLPFFILFYLIDKSLFIDEEATELANNGHNIPAKGIPTSFA